MKTKTRGFTALAILSSLTLPTVGVASLEFKLLQTQTGEWTNSFDQSFFLNSGTTNLSGNLTVTSNVQVAKYTGLADLGKVIIRFEQPNYIATISAVLASGSQEFSTFTYSIETRVSAAQLAGDIRNTVVGNATFTYPQDTLFQKSEQAAGPITLSDTVTTRQLTNSLNKSFYESHIITTDNPENVTQAQIDALNSLFRDSGGSGKMNFTVDNVAGLNVNRSDTGPALNVDFSGTDFGTVTVEYYTIIPEPSTYSLITVLALCGIVVALRVRRR